MHRTHLQRHLNILKRLLIHVAGFNLSLVLREDYGICKPRGLQDIIDEASGWIVGIIGNKDRFKKGLKACWRSLEDLSRQTET